MTKKLTKREQNRLAVAEALESGEWTQKKYQLGEIYEEKKYGCCLGVASYTVPKLGCYINSSGTMYARNKKDDCMPAYSSLERETGIKQPIADRLANLNDQGVPFTLIAKLFRLKDVNKGVQEFYQTLMDSNYIQKGAKKVLYQNKTTQLRAWVEKFFEEREAIVA